MPNALPASIIATIDPNTRLSVPASLPPGGVLDLVSLNLATLRSTASRRRAPLHASSSKGLGATSQWMLGPRGSFGTYRVWPESASVPRRDKSARRRSDIARSGAAFRRHSKNHDQWAFFGS